MSRVDGLIVVSAGFVKLSVVRVMPLFANEAFQFFTKDAFNCNNIKKHMQEHHPKQWAKYIEVRNEKESNSDAFNVFFEQSKLRAFFFKKSEVNGVVSYSMNKNIVEIIIWDMLFDENKLV